MHRQAQKGGGGWASALIWTCMEYISPTGFRSPDRPAYTWSLYRLGYSGRFISSIHLVVCLTTGPKPLPKRALHILRSRASSFKWEYPLLSLRSANSFLRLLPCLSVTSIRPCIFSSITRCRRQFLRKMWPIQFAFRLRISCRIFLYSLTLSNTSSFLTWSVYEVMRKNVIKWGRPLTTIWRMRIACSIPKVPHTHIQVV